MRFSLSWMIVTALALSLFSCSDDPAEPEGDLIEFPDGPFEFYELLSEYGFFSGALADLNPVASVFPYELSTALFSDYTIKDRFIWMPRNTAMEYRAEGIVGFPPGTFLIKNFSSLDESDNELRLETRMLLLDPYDDKWKVMVYLWNDDRTDALKHIIGRNTNIRVKDDQGNVINTLYRIPNTNDCKRCHNNFDEVVPIGPRIRSMNYTPAGLAQNQLDKWSDEDRLTGLPSSGVPILPDWTNDIDFSLDSRARAYLDINCAHCHREGGDAYGTGLFLDFDESDSTQLGFYKTPLAAGPGTGGLTYDIVPGQADQSILHYRINSDVPGIAMPEIARSVIHQDGVELIREWINSF